jgi:hypothetical protein
VLTVLVLLPIGAGISALVLPSTRGAEPQPAPAPAPASSGAGD